MTTQNADTSQEKSARHTPGPWRVEPETEDQALSIVAGENAGQDSETIIAEIGGVFGDCEEANAALIAAAPDLLDALKEALPRFALALKMLGNSPDVVALSTSKITAAIAKAEKP